MTGMRRHRSSTLGSPQTPRQLAPGLRRASCRRRRSSTSAERAAAEVLGAGLVAGESRRQFRHHLLGLGDELHDRQRLGAEVAAGHQPLVVLLDEHSADQPWEALFARSETTRMGNRAARGQAFRNRLGGRRAARAPSLA
jgi:hypothetical protein